MSEKHLGKGSSQPPKAEGKLRLYSMKFCPFAQRVRLILLVKNIPHDIVNVDLKNKPEWLFDLQPEGKVPILDTGSQIIVDSVGISNYLDEKYPGFPLYPQDEEKQEQDKTLIKEFDGLMILYFMTIHKEGTYKENITKMRPHLEKLENKLKTRGTYFGGNQPNMVDYMIWPWGERAPLVGLVQERELPKNNEFPHLYSWCKAMRTQKAAQQTETSIDRLFEVQKQYNLGKYDIDYDISNRTNKNILISLRFLKYFSEYIWLCRDFYFPIIHLSIVWYSSPKDPFSYTVKFPYLFTA